jgi:hypothetical protein
VPDAPAFMPGVLIISIKKAGVPITQNTGFYETVVKI